MTKFTITCAAFIAATAATAAAQTQYNAMAPADYPEPGTEEYAPAGIAGPISFDIGIPLSIPVSDSGRRFDSGTGFTTGITFMPERSPVGVEAEYMFTYYDVENDLFESTRFDGRQIMHNGGINIVVRPPRMKRFGFYVLGGGGIYARDVEVSEYGGTGVAPFCDPFLFACFPQAVAVSEVVGSQDSFDFGVSGGLGVYATLATPMRLYLEARYHHIWGPSFTGPQGETVNAHGEYVPVVLGLAF
jgi:opacity protein-like surface antigen